MDRTLLQQIKHLILRKGKEIRTYRKVIISSAKIGYSAKLSTIEIQLEQLVEI